MTSIHRTRSHSNQLLLKLTRLILPIFAAILFLSPLAFIGSTPTRAAGFGEITKQVSKSSVQAGEEFQYTIVITNLTGANVVATITDTVPTGIVVQQVLDGGTLSNGVITWNATVNNGQKTQVRFTALAQQSGTLYNSDYGVTSGQYSSVGSPVPITVSPGNPHHLTVNVNPTSLMVGPASTASLNVTVEDVYGNPLGDNTVVSLSYNLGSIDGQPAGSTITATTTAGQVNKTFSAMTVAGTARITVTAGALSPVVKTISLLPGPPNLLSASAAPTTISVVGGQQSVITGQVQDQYANPIDGQPITFTTNLGQLNGVGTTVVAATSGGKATATLAGTTAGTATITVQSGALAPANAQVYLSPGPPTQIRFNPPSNVPISIEADGQSSVNLELQVLDMHGNLVTQPTPVTITTSLGKLTGGGTTYTKTTTDGLVPFTLTSITQTGTANLSAVAGSLNTDRSVNFMPGNPASVELSVTPPAIVANGASTAAIVATAYDKYHNIVKDKTITFTFAAARGTLNGAATESTTSGSINRTLTSDTTLGTVPITVTVTGLITPGLGSVQFIVGPPAQVNVTAATLSTEVGQTVPLTFTLYDSVGHVIPAVPITVASTIGNVSPATANTDAGGQAFLSLFSTRAGAATLAVTSTAGAVSVTGNPTITFNPGPPQLASLQASPTSIVADGLTTAVITATVTDIYANPVQGVTPAFSTTLGTLAGAGATNAGGVTTRTLRSSTTLGTAQVSVSGLTASPVNVNFVVGPPASAILQATPTTAYVLGLGTPDAVTVVITVTDQVGHAIANASPVVTSTFGSLSGCTGTNSEGMLTCTLKSTKSGTPTIYVGGIAATGDTITFIPGPTAASIEVTPNGTLASPVHVTSGQSFPFSAVAKDVYKNPIPSAIFNWGIRPNPPGDGTGTIDTGGVVIGQKAGRMIVSVSSNKGGYVESHLVVDPGPAAKGQLTASPTSLPIGTFSDISLLVTDSYGNAINTSYCPTLNSSIGIPTINCVNPSTGIAIGTVTSITQTGVANLTVPGLSPVTGNTSLTFTPGPPVKVTVKAGTTTLHANGVSSTPITVTLKDNYSNPVLAGYTIHSISSTAGVLSCGSFTTNSAGQLLCTLTAGTIEGVAVFTVRYTAGQTLIHENSDTVNIVITEPVSMIIDPSGPLTVTAGITTPFQVTVYDVGNAIVPPSRLNYSWFAESQGGQGDFSPVPADSRQTSFIGKIAGTVRVRVSVWDANFNYVSPGLTYVTILPAPPINGTLAVSPGAVPADGASPVNLTLSAMNDVYGNVPRDGDTVTFYINTPQPQVITGTVAGNLVSASFTSTTVAGTFPITVANSYNQQISLFGQTAVTFTAGAPLRATIATATPPQIIANGVNTSTVVLQITDQYSNPVSAGWPLSLASSLGTFPASGTTAANGLVTGTLQAGLILGDARITVTHGVNPFLAGGAVPLVAGPAVSATLAASTTTLAAGDPGTQLTFTVADAWGHPVSGQVLTPTISPALASFSGSQLVQNGQLVRQLVPLTQTGVATVGLQGVTVTGSTAFTVVPNVAAIARVTAAPKSLTVGQDSSLLITITDAYGNLVPATAITVTSTLTGTFDGLTSPVVKTTVGSSGQISTVLRSTNAGLDPLAFAGPAGPLSLHPGSDAVEFKPDSLIIVTLDVTGPITWMAGTPLTITASSRDRFYNIIDPWQPVDYIWSQNAAVNGPGYGTVTGIDARNRSVEFLPMKTGVNALQAINAPFRSNPLTVTVVAAPPTQGLVPVTPASVQANNASTTTIRLTNLTDVYGNDVADGHTITVTVDTRSATGVVSAGEARVVLTATTKAGTHAITARSAAGPMTLTGFPSVTFTPGPPAKAVVTATQKIVPVDQPATLNILVYDQFNNLVSDGTLITVTVSKANVAGNSSPTLGGGTSRTVNPFALGDGLISIAGASGTLFLQGDNKLTFIPGSAVFAEVTASKTKVLGDGVSTSALDIVIKDGLHFPVTGSGTAVMTVTRGVVLPTSTLVTDGRFGVAYTANRSVGPVAMQISYNGQPMTVQGDSLELIAGPPYAAVLTATPTVIRVDSSDQSTLRFSLFDQWNNPVPAGTVVTTTASMGLVAPLSGTTTGNVITFTLTPETAAGPVVFTVTAASAASPLVLSGDAVTITPGGIHHIAVQPDVPVWVTAGGSTSFSAIGYDKYNNQTSTGPFNWRKVYGSGDGLLSGGVFTGTLAGTLGIQAYTGTIYSPEKSVTILPGSLFTTVVKATPITVSIGGVPSQLAITARDAYGNLVADGTSASVTTDLGTLTGTGVTKNGVLTRTLLSSNFSGRAHIFVNGKAASGDTVFFSPRAWMTAIPGTLVADGTSQAEVRVRILDGDGLPTGQLPKTVTSTLGILNYNQCTTSADTFVCTLTAPTTVGQAAIYVDGLPAQGVVTFTTGTPSRATISASPKFVTVNGWSTSTLTISVQDDFGHVITNYTGPLTVTTSLGSIGGVQSTVNGVTRRTLTGGALPGVATISVAGLSAYGDYKIPVRGVVARISASPKYLIANGKDSAVLTIALEDDTGQPLTGVNLPITVTTSLGTLSGVKPTVNGVTNRTLTAASSSGMAAISVAGMTATGDTKVQFVGNSFVDGDFESGLANWIVGNSYAPLTSTQVYSGQAVGNDTVGSTMVTPHGLGSKMVRLGATSSDNRSHAVGDTWLRQSVYVTPTGVTQVSYWYRLLSYDVSVGSADRGYLEWDPFKVYLNGQQKWQDKDAIPERVWSWEWQNWRDGPPSPPPSPLDTGWRQGVLDLTPYAGQVVSLEFRVSNNVKPEDNTWVYIDDVGVTYRESQIHNVYLPIVIK